MGSAAAGHLEPALHARTIADADGRSRDVSLDCRVLAHHDPPVSADPPIDRAGDVDRVSVYVVVIG